MDNRPLLTDMVGGGMFGLKPAEWTDDASMALGLAESLTAQCAKHTDEFEEPVRSLGPAGREQRDSPKLRDRDAVSAGALRTPGETAVSTSIDPQGAGNGTLMRLAPVVIFAGSDVSHAMDLTEMQSRTTHRAP